MTKYQIWCNRDGGVRSFFREQDHYAKRNTLDKDAAMLHEFEVSFPDHDMEQAFAAMYVNMFWAGHDTPRLENDWRDSHLKQQSLSDQQIFDKYGDYSGFAEQIDIEIHRAIEPIFNRLVKMGHCPREVGHLMMLSVIDTESAIILTQKRGME